MTLAGIELMHMIRKGQLQETCPAQNLFAGGIKPIMPLDIACPAGKFATEPNPPPHPTLQPVATEPECTFPGLDGLMRTMGVFC